MIHFILRTTIIFSFLFLTGFSVHAQHARECSSDHMAEQLRQQFPKQAEADEDFYQRVIPSLIKHQPTSQRSVAKVLYVPIVVHVIHSGEPIGTGSNLSDAQIQAQIDVLNEDFSAQNANFNQTPSQWTSVIGNPNIQFCLAKIDPDGNPSNGITRHNLTITGTSAHDSNIEDDIKPETTWDAYEYYNIWTLPIPGTTANGGTLGYAILPNSFIIGDDVDGSVVDWRWFGGPGFNQSAYKTLTHETGHYLGLPHTFNEESCFKDDNIADTPNMSQSTSSLIPDLNCSDNNFPTGPSSCGEEHMYVNYMDYVSSDYCSTSFTTGQIAVMRGVLEGDRPFDYGSRELMLRNTVATCDRTINDIGITSVIQPEAGTICNYGSVTPQIKIRNHGTETVTTFSVSYQIDNGTPVTENFVDNINSGGSVTIDLPTFTPPTTAYDFKVYTQHPNGETDIQAYNDTTSVSSQNVTLQGIPFLEDFTATEINPTAAGSYTFNPHQDDFAWQHVPISANGSSGGSILFDNYEGSNDNNPSGTYDTFFTPVLDFSNKINILLNFDVAYARYTYGVDQFVDDYLRIYVSTDCGLNYNELVFDAGGADLETGTATGSAFTPTSDEWGNINVDLTSYDNQSNVSLAFVNASGWGNRLFLDNINIAEDHTYCRLSTNPGSSSVSCFGESDGIARIFPSRGTPPYAYLWDNQETTQSILTGPGIFSVTVTDAAGCTSTNIVEVSEPAPLGLEVDKTDETLTDVNDGTATAMATGGSTGFDYYGYSADYSFEWSSGATTSSIENLAPGNYGATVTDSRGCTEEESFVIEPSDVMCNMIGYGYTQAAPCFGQTDGGAAVNVEGGTFPYTTLWNNGSTDPFINAGPGIYTCTVTDARECTVSIDLEIEVEEPFVYELHTSPESVSGANDGSAFVYIDGWYDGAIFSYSWSHGPTTYKVEDLAPGDYTVTITHEDGCAKEEILTIEPAPVICDLIATSSVTEPFCFGDQGTINISVEGGTEPYLYTWSNGQTNNIFSAPAGTYSVTITDANECTDLVTIEVSEPAPINLGVDKTDETIAGANDGTATANVSGGAGGYTFNWSNNATTPSVTNLAPGNYSVTVTDQNECTNEVDFVIQQGAVDCGQLSLELEPVATRCMDSNDGSINATPIGGTGNYQYNWSNGMSTRNIINLSSGTYQLTITDQLGCSLSKATIVNAPSALTATISATENPAASAPSGGTASVSASGGVGNYFYQWSNGGTTATIDGLSADIYSVTVFDNNECTWTGSIEVTDEEIDCSNLNLNITSNNISCHGAADGFINALASGGSPEYIYQWDNGMNTAAINNLTAGTYQVTITDINGCSIIENVQITEATPIIPNISASSDPCNSVGGTLSVDPNGGESDYQVNWSNGVTDFNNDITQNGDYQVTITDAAGCTAIDAASITVSSSIIELGIDTENISCAGNNDGLATANINGGMAPYTYNWSTGSTDKSITDLSAGTYSVEITDAMGCQRDQVFTVTAPAPIVLNCAGTPESNGADGFVQVSGTGGTAPYQYDWSTGDTGSFIQGISNGTYEATVTDQNGCSSMCTVDLISTNTETPANFTALEVFPNPASEELFIHADLLEYESVRISLVNLIGQTVISETTSGTTIRNRFQLTDLSAGTYLLRLETGNGTTIRKVVISK